MGPLADPEAIKELEERQRKEVDALESKLEAEEAEQIKEIERQVNEEYTKDMKKGHRDILENVSGAVRERKTQNIHTIFCIYFCV